MTAKGDGKCAKSNRNEKRRSNKPLMEKRRRARINHSLSVLKSLIVKDEMANCQNATSQSRLEKADILELTVVHVRTLEKERAEYQQHLLQNRPNNRLGDETDTRKTDDARSYQVGYQACLNDIGRFLNDPALEETKERLLGYLNEQKPKHPNHGSGGGKVDVNISPTRLADGRLALVFSPSWVPSANGSETSTTNAHSPASSYHYNPAPATPPSSPAQQVATPGCSSGVWRPWF